MSESTPLLPRPNKVAGDAPIFARVCHSPWAAISQQSLTIFRGFIAVYMIVVFSMSLDHSINHTKNGGKVFPFVASNVSWVMQTIYYIITFVSQCTAGGTKYADYMLDLDYTAPFGSSI